MGHVGWRFDTPLTPTHLSAISDTASQDQQADRTDTADNGDGIEFSNLTRLSARANLTLPSA